MDHGLKKGGTQQTIVIYVHDDDKRETHPHLMFISLFCAPPPFRHMNVQESTLNHSRPMNQGFDVTAEEVQFDE